MPKLNICIIAFLILYFHSGYSQIKKKETGIASYYHDYFNGRKTASGERYSPDELTAAHLSLPFNTIVLVKNLKNDRTVIVRINDRGPFINNRIIDLSRAAADSLDIIDAGIVKVEIKVLGRDSLNDTLKKPFFRKLFKKKNKAAENIVVAKSDVKVVELQSDSTAVTRVVYGIQIGSFRERSNMLRLSERLKADFITKFNVQEIQKDKVLFYRMILGEFDDYKSAEQLKQKINKEFPGCFVVKYSI